MFFHGITEICFGKWRISPICIELSNFYGTIKDYIKIHLRITINDLDTNRQFIIHIMS